MPGGEPAIWLIGLFVPILLIFLAFWVIYRIVPNRPVSWGEVLPARSSATILWTLLRFGFTWYATSVAATTRSSAPSRPASPCIVFLYFASVVVLLGAEFARANALDDEIGPIARPTRGCCRSPWTRPRPAPHPIGAVRVGAGRRRALVGVVVGRITKRDE